MKYGIREICDVVLKAKSKMTVGNKIFYKDEPVIYFDSLKTSTMEGAATTVYAQGGRGNSRLIAWEGERTVTFTMEDALISTVGLAILTGADVIDATEAKPIIQHVTEQFKLDSDRFDSTAKITLDNIPYMPTKKDADGNQVLDTAENWIYVMVLDQDGNVDTEPYIYEVVTKESTTTPKTLEFTNQIQIKSTSYLSDAATRVTENAVVLVDYYTAKTSKAKQIEITPDKFGGNFYLEASTLFRDTNGVDMPAEFIIPNCKVQSNFTFTMASSGDPSTFTFTMDAFPGYTRFNPEKKVLSAIQIIEEIGGDNDNVVRYATDANPLDPTTTNGEEIRHNGTSFVYGDKNTAITTHPGTPAGE